MSFKRNFLQEIKDSVLMAYVYLLCELEIVEINLQLVTIIFNMVTLLSETNLPEIQKQKSDNLNDVLVYM